MSWRLVLVAGLALVLAFTARWFWPSERSAIVLPSLPDPRFDYSLENFSARFLDDDGRLELQVSGPRLVHDSASRTVTLTEPRFRLDPEGSHWEGQSELGYFLRDADELILSGDVRFTQALPVGETLITGERLQHDRRARTIHSDRPVEIHRPGTLLRAGGLIVNLEDDSIELFNDLHGQFQAAPALPRDSRTGSAAPGGSGR